MIGPQHVLLHERAVVAAHFGPRPLRMQEEIEVVDRHHLGRPLRRNQRRPGRVDHVVAAGDHLDGRPFLAVPQPVEHPHRNPGVDDAEALEIAPIDPVLPGAGEDRQLVAGLAHLP